MQVQLSKADVSFWIACRRKREGAFSNFDTHTADHVLDTLLPSKGDAEQEAGLYTRKQLLEVVKQLQRARRVIFKALPKEKTVLQSKRVQPLLPPAALHAAPIIPEERGGAAPPPIYSESGKARPSAMAGGDVENVVEVMRRNPKNELIQVKGCIALLDHIALSKRLSGSGKGAHELTDVWICGTCSYRNVVQKHKVAYTLEELASSGERCFLCTSLPTSGSKESIKNARAATKTISNAADSIFSMGGVKILTDALRRFPNCLGLQRNVCFALARLASRDNRVVPAFIGGGGLPLLFAAMRALIDEPEIQAQCMGILGSPEIASDDVVRIDCDSCARIVLDVARAYGAHKRLMSLCCLALANLAMKNEMNVELLCRAGAPKVVIDCLKRNAGNMNALASGVWTLLALTRFLESGYHTEARLLVRNCGAVHFAARALDEIDRLEEGGSGGSDMIEKTREQLLLLMSYMGADYADEEETPDTCIVF